MKLSWNSAASRRAARRGWLRRNDLLETLVLVAAMIGLFLIGYVCGRYAR